MIHTAPSLFATRLGILVRVGKCRCFYCGFRCDDSTPTASHVKSTFTARDTVTGGSHVCDGCLAVMDESGDVVLPDGAVRTGQKRRCYSYVVGKTVTATTKAHREWLLNQSLNPPEPPFVICLSDSGQKHLLYRAVVCHSRDPVTVTLEAEPITFAIADLSARMELCQRVAAVIGLPGLSAPLSARGAMALIEHHEDESLPEAWQSVEGESLSRLARWFCPKKEVCLEKFPARDPAARKVQCRRVSATAGRSH